MAFISSTLCSLVRLRRTSGLTRRQLQIQVLSDRFFDYAAKHPDFSDLHELNLGWSKEMMASVERQVRAYGRSVSLRLTTECRLCNNAILIFSS